MSKNYETGIDPNLKEQINKEGWETGKDYNLKTEEEKEGGAAVYVGNKEEAEKAREIAETEGKAENLASYIRMHKVIKVESDEVLLTAQVGKEVLCPGKAWIEDYRTGTFKLLYIDKDGNIVEVEIKAGKIASFLEKNPASVIEELRDLGFDLQEVYGGNNSEYNWALGQIYKKQDRLNKETKENKKRGFDF